MGKYPADLKYTKEHEWARVEGARARVGITGYAQEQLGDVVFVELPKVGTKVSQMQPFVLSPIRLVLSSRPSSPSRSRVSRRTRDFHGVVLCPASRAAQRRIGGVQRRSGWRAARVWSRRRTGVVRGASWITSGFDSASRAIWIMASQNASIVSLDSVSVGSIINASSTTSGKYVDGA